ncbi:MAG: hypothetical protein IT208_10815 [Chthonomonadales bacterium]|nr:hypothetical protein [Chthonomonadales bacterium]
MRRRAAETALDTGAEAAVPPEPTAQAEESAAPRRRRAAGAGTKQARKAAARGKGDTAAVVEALLRTRGLAGATQDDLQTAVTWAQTTRAEAEAIRGESVRRRAPRGATKSPRARAAAARQLQTQREQLQERTTRNEMDRALLDGIIAGTLAVDVKGGQLVFLHERWLTTPSETPAAPAEDAG